MKEIDQMLEQWIYNSIIRDKLRELIIKAINKHAEQFITFKGHRLSNVEWMEHQTPSIVK